MFITACCLLALAASGPQTSPPGAHRLDIELLYLDLTECTRCVDTSTRLDEALSLDVLQRGRAVYLMVEPWRQDNSIIRRLLARYPHERLPDIGIWAGVQLYRLRPAPAP